MTMDSAPSSHLDDEALSAAIDGAADPGVIDHVASCARCRSRHGELSRARAELAAAPVEPLDELTRRRLIAAALASAPNATSRARRAWYQRPAFAGAVAAGILAVLASVPFITGDGSDTASEQAARSANDARESAAVFLGDVGDVSDPAVLRGRLATSGTEELMSGAMENDTFAGPGSAGAATKSAGPPAADAAPEPAAPAPSVQPPVAAGESEAGRARTAVPSTPAALDQAAVDECVTSLNRGPTRGDRLVATAIGTYRGTPAVVAVFSTGEGTIAFVTARDGCQVLDRYPA